MTEPLAAADKIVAELSHADQHVYVSGPITSGILSDLPFETRLEVNGRLLDHWSAMVSELFPADYAVINPAMYQLHGHDSWGPSDWDEMWSSVILQLSPAIAVLTPGWSWSNGCRSEIGSLLEVGARFHLINDVGITPVHRKCVQEAITLPVRSFRGNPA